MKYLIMCKLCTGMGECYLKGKMQQCPVCNGSGSVVNKLNNK